MSHVGSADLITLAARSGLLDETAARDRLAGASPTVEALIESGLLTREQIDGLLNRATITRESVGIMPRPSELPAEVADASRDPARAFGHYVRVRELGRGGFGTVWLAWDTVLRRRVALKILKEQGPEDSARFKREAQMAAALSHPNIAAVYEVGEVGAEHFIALQYVEGDTLAKVRLSPKEAMEAVRDMARAVAYAHRQGVIHRDLKPQNAMRADDPSAGAGQGGRVYVLDFGLAKLTKAGSSLTVSATIVGTPAYMSPEQARGEKADERTDVYGLGATLYELVTGQPPFSGENVMAVLRQVLDSDPVAPSKLNPRLPGDIETILRKAMEKEPARRYESVAAFADDIERQLAGDPIHARPVSTAERLWRGARKKRAVVVPTAAAVVLGFALGGWAIVGAHQRKAAERRAFEENEQEAQDLLVRAKPELQKAVDSLYDEKTNYEVLVNRVEVGQGMIEAAIEKAPHLAEGHYLLGRAWGIRGWDDRAEASWRRAIALDPDFGMARYELGRLLAMRAIVATLAGAEENREAHLARARAWAEEAQRELELALGMNGCGDALQLEIGKAILAYVTRDKERVLGISQEAVKTYGNVNRAEDFYLLIGLVSQGDERIRAYDEAIRRRPKHHLARFFRGIAVQEQGDLDGAIADYDEAIRINLRFVWAYANRGIARQDKGNLEGAVADYDEAIRIDPCHAGAYYNRGNAKRDKGDLDGAFADFSETIRVNPRYAYAYGNRGVLRALSGDLEGAMADYNQALRINPRNERMLANRGNARMMQGDLDGALVEFNEAVRIKPGFALALAGRGSVRTAKSDFDGAITDCDEAIRTDPRCVEAYVSRGGARFMKGDLDGAIADYDQAIRINARCAEAYLNRGGARLAKGDLDGAIADCDEAIRINPSLARACVNRGDARMKKDDIDGAIADYNEAIRIDPRCPEAYFNRGIAREAHGDLEGAIADTEKALEVAPKDSPHHKRFESELEALRRERDGY